MNIPTTNSSTNLVVIEPKDPKLDDIKIALPLAKTILIRTATYENYHAKVITQTNVENAELSNLITNIIAVKKGNDLVVTNADASTVIFKGFYTTCNTDDACTVTLGGEEEEVTITPDSPIGQALSDGGFMVYAYAHSGNSGVLTDMVTEIDGVTLGLSDLPEGMVSYIPTADEASNDIKGDRWWVAGGIALVAGIKAYNTSHEFTVDTVPPTITINDITSDNIINSNEVTTSITGTVEAGSSVSLNLGGQDRSATVTGDSWTYTLTATDITNMGQGAETLTATATDTVGNERMVSHTFTVDTIVPTITIDAIANDNIINSNEVTTTITGTVDTGSTVELILGNTARAATVSGNIWSYTLTQADTEGMGQGAETITATATDTVGNIQQASHTFTVDTVPPTRIIIDIALDNIINSNEATATITGMVEAGSTVRLGIAGTARTATVSGTSWSYSLTSADIDNMGQGAETITITAIDTAGNERTVSRDITVDTVLPTITIDGIASDNIINSNEVTTSITGTVEAGSSVSLNLGGQDRSATVTGDSWTYTLTATDITNMGQGAETITITAIDTAGNERTASHEFTVDTVLPAITIDGIASDNIISTSELSAALITGTVEAGSTVELTFGNTARSAMATVIDSTWSYTLTPTDISNIISQGLEVISASPTDISNMYQGTGRVTVTATDTAGNTQQAILKFTVDTLPPTIAIDPITLDNIINSNEVTTSITGTVEAGSSVSLNLGGQDRSATVTGDSWTYTLTATDITNMGQGAETLTATATDTAGNERMVSHTFTVDTIVPTITIDAIANDNIINSNKVTTTITGTVDTGSTVSLNLGGVDRIANVTGGTWSYVLTATDITVMGEGTKTITATATDAAGNAAMQVVTVTVTNINDDPVGLPTISGTATQGEILTVNTDAISDADGLGAFSYQWNANDTAISGATDATFELTQAQVGATITVTVSYTDDGNTAETLISAATNAVTNTNDDPTGLPTISGTATQGEILTAITSSITDADGFGNAGFSYQWQADGTDINGATGTTFELTQDQVGDTITVTVSYTDGGNTAESLTSAATSAITNTNDAPTGLPTISGTASQGATLTANTDAISDADGFGNAGFSYQWQAGGNDISGATDATFELTQAQVGATITVTVSYTDGGGTDEILTSAATSAVTNTNDAPTGLPTISGTASQGATLTANTDAISDADGLGAFSYQWQAGGTDISDATGMTFELTQAQVGATITVTVSYTDGGNTAETLTSAATNAVTNTNDDPTGLPTISGIATQGEILTAITSSITDADGLGTGGFSYQWQADGTDISGATGETFELTQAQVGKPITVTVSYTDGGDTDESLTSIATNAVTNTNDDPIGLPTISGTATQGEILTVNTDAISDADGLGAFSYQWQAGGNDISGATDATFELTQDQVGATITVTVSYTDGGSTTETLTSAATATVTNTNDAPTGLPAISGTATQGEILTVNTDAISDADGLGAFSYQWQAGGNDISGADEATFELTQAQVGATITVKVSYTDGGNTAESLTSAATNAVTNTNDAPTGTVTIDGTATQGATLTANTDAISDADGLGAFSYQWQAGGTDINGATGTTFELTQDQVGKPITVTVSYTDGGNTAETLTSAATSAVTNTNDAPTGLPTISGTPTQGEILTVNTDSIADADGFSNAGFSYQWQASGTNISGATGTTFELTQAQVGATITVKVSYTDGGNTAESLTSAATNAVTNTNDDPTGAVTIDGIATQGATLTANTDAISDADGFGNAGFSYQWQADGTDINGATGTTFELTQDQVGDTITVKVSYTDGGNTAESLTSAATNAVTNTNDAPTGAVTITGTPTQGATLTVNTDSIADADGFGNAGFSYQWQADGTDISGATESTFVLTQTQVGKPITVTVSYTDGGNTAETLTSAATSAITNTNDAPTGAVTITGTPTQGEILTVNTDSIADADGFGNAGFSYQWQAGGNDISGATAATFELTQAQVGATITVKVSYTDGGNTAESLTSAATNAVTNTNDAPTGLPTITGTASQGATLTVNTDSIADADGLGTGGFSYQWQAGGNDIRGATGTTFELTQAQVGATITVKVSYTDGGNTAESLTSAATNAVTNTNDDPTGLPTISGTPTQGEILTAQTGDISDADELGDFSYQWQAGGNDISGATDATFELTQAQVGATITVKVSYTDGGSTDETLTSAATNAVTNTNDAPTGLPTITGTPTQGETLTAQTGDISDADELGDFSYQWQAGGNDISGATDATFELTQAQVGATITVKVSYTDGGNTAESLISAATNAVTNTNDAPTGLPTITGTPTQGETLTAQTGDISDADELGDFSYQWQAGGNDISGATDATFELTQAQVGATITVKVSYTDGGNTAESLISAATNAVTNTNDAPTGLPTISGTATQGATLTAFTSSITDADGLGAFSYQWQAGGNAINGATAATFELTQAQVGATITVKVSYTDGGNTAESLTSAATNAVTNTNDDPTGLPTITGTPTQGATLTVNTDSIADADGFGNAGFSYQWQADGTDISGADEATFELTQAQVGATITVKVSYTDGGNTAESLTSAATNAVTNTNDAPTGLPTITGTPTQGETLTAQTGDISDADGLGDFSYQWQAGGNDISGADEATFELTQAQVGATITVKVSYTDGGNTAESLTSAATNAVTNTNDAPTGLPTISGTATQGEILTVNTDAISDADGLGAFSYQWNANDTNISGATDATFELTQAQVGATITVKVSYTDGGNTAESLTSAATNAVTNTNDAPTGLPTISGTATQGEILTVNTDAISDADGLGAFSYQWNANDTAISGATDATFELTQAQVGATITVTVSYTDDGNTAETLISAATNAVTNTNDDPTGLPTISGIATQGEILTAITSSITDADGLGTGGFSYQWQADGTDISGADEATFELTQAQVGAAITVKVSYTDGGNTAESLTSAATNAVTNTNDDPTGLPTITGTASQGATLTVNTDSIADADGLGTGGFSYQWQAGGNDISGATGTTFELTQAQVGATITVKVSYTDGGNTAESLTSAATNAVANTNDDPTGLPTISGTPTQGEILTVNTDSIADADGLGTGGFSYQWQAGGNDISGATAATFELTQAQVGATITVKVSYTDAGNTAETLTSAATNAVTNTNDDPTGLPTITGTPTQGAILTANTDAISDADGLGDFSYQWQADATDISGATGTTFELTQAQVGATITVKVSYTDGGNTAETLTSAATNAVTNTNDDPTGLPTITGTASQGATLTVNTDSIADADGLGTGGFSYQWQAGGNAINGATAATFELTQAQVGATITVKVSYTDGGNTAESLTSAATNAVTNTNDEPTGLPTITGTASQGATLTAITDAISDADGLGAFSYQWQAGGNDISGATGTTFELTQAQVGATITVKVSYTDGGNTAESLTSAATNAVTNTNDDPTGLPTITGTASQGATLTVNTDSIADADGLGTGGFSYQWQAGGNDISGATGTTFELTQAQVGATITVKVSYTDGGNTAESLTSAATNAVTNTNDEPTGLPTITGTASQGATLTVNTDSIADADGLGTGGFSYQWQAGGNDISGATGTTFELTQAQVGATITVKVSYTDGGNTAESLTSAATNAVTNTNDDPTGLPTITGTASQGATLTVNTDSIADADGLGTGGFSYQWQADGTDISGATESTFVLTQTQVGKPITVTVSYTDGGNTVESLTSAATSAVANTNDAPTGLPTISGTATQGATLTANTDAISDADGLGAFSYQWQAGGNDISGATDATFELTQAQVGATITVKVSYTDGGNTAESLTSAATNAVTNTNDAPTGLPTITGTPTQGETLTAQTGDISDADGFGNAGFSYQWQADGTDISGATESTFVLTQTQVGKPITVTVSYTDGGNTAESLTSAATNAVTNTNDAPTGLPTITGTPTQGETLTVNTDSIADADGFGNAGFSYQWQADATDISGATGTTFELTQAQVGATITVKVSYTDGGSTAETLTSAATSAVSNTNDDPTGLPTITGTPTQGAILTVNTDSIADADGLGTGGFSYQWQAGGNAINGATAATFELTQAQVGATITVTVSYTDDGNTAETLISAATNAVTNTNDDPTGLPTISGIATQGEILTAITSSITDADGLGTGGFSYQWQADGTDISDATGTTFELTQAQVGAAITVKVSYTDGGNTAESLTSAATNAVTNTNDDPTGLPTITGTASQGATLTVNTDSIADADGLGTGGFSYQWQAGGNDISGATGTTFELTQAQVGATITVKVSYTDGGNTAESLTSIATATVTNTNDAPTGTVTIDGTATQGATLTVNTDSIADADGLGTGGFSYQWQAGGNDISGATGTTFELTQAQVGATITVKVSYTDGGNTAESLTSAATNAVTNTNDDPTGLPTITGTASQGATLTVNTDSIADADGLGTGGFSYQWQAGGNDISGATGTTFELTQAQVGATITVKVSYTDGGNTAESLTSAATNAVTNTNDDPTGLPTITGTASQGATLTVNTDSIADADGLGTGGFSYQWQAGGNDISGATGTTFELTQAQVGATITVKVSYTDGGNTAESLTSAATNAVTNTNDDPTGLPTITGTASQGATLTVNTDSIADADGLGTGGFSYQWQAGGNDISGATGTTFELTQAQVGATITVKVSYTDGGNTAESLTSAATNAVTNTNDDPTGLPTITGTASQGATLTVNTDSIADADGLGTGGFSYQWQAGGNDISGATGTTFELTQAQVGATITVKVSYTDGGNTAESLTSAATSAVANTNDDPTGLPTITGTPTQGAILTVNTDSIDDADGFGNAGFSYQWQAGGNAISGATDATFELTQAQVGATITVKVSYTDGGNTAESLTSAATNAVTNTNDDPTGLPTITGTASQGATLTVNTDSIADADGLGTGGFSYQWQAGGNDISGATGTTFELTQAQVGATITVKVSYTDGGNTAESLTSAATNAVTNTNDDPTGLPTITGTASQGATLTVNTDSIADADGLGTGGFSYQWQAGGNDISGATGTTFELTQAQVGATITVKVSYTDGGNTAESLTSAATNAVTNTNDDPTGLPTITGTASQGATLTVNTDSIADADGLGTGGFSYQWQAGGNDISGATGTTFELTQAQVGATITVKVSYTDGGNTAESLTSAATNAVTNTNDDPTGLPTITGTASQGATLTVNTDSIADADGLGTGGFSYQWQAGGNDISGATGTTFELTQAQVGATITVKVSYTDGGNTAESLTSAATNAVTNTNDDPTGLPTITGTASQGATLTVNTDSIADADGLGTGGFSYQWQAGGNDISGATGTTFELTQAQVGATITVKVSYTDGGNTAESLTSAATNAVANTNDDPTGLPTITGTPTQGATLTAQTGDISDADGLGDFSYQWQAGGNDISGADEATFELTQAQVGATITVKVSYTDGGNTAESLTSAATNAVTNTNDAPTGLPTISGTATQGEILTVNTDAISDADGLGAFSYQWNANDTNISGATDATFELTQAQVGATITVKVSYTDGGNTAESLTSAATNAVTNTNDAPTGLPTISGTATQGEILTVNTDAISDADGLGAFSYQWNANDTAISGATDATFELTQAQVGATITVKVSYTDGGNTAESLTSAATNAVTDEIAPVFSSGATVSVDVNENTPIATVVYNAEATDNNGADDEGITYTLSGADADAFNINADSGEVTLKAAADFKTQSSYALAVTATDAAGNATTQTVTVTVIDTTPPMIAFHDITADNIINANEVSTSITGSVEAGSGVKLSLGGNTRTATVATDGTWSYILTSADIAAMEQGAETITVTATDAAGNEGTASRDITVDTIAPAISIDEDIAGDDIIDSSEVPTSITGTVDAGSTVELSLDGNTRTITVEADGTWSYTLTLIDIDNIGQGVKTITATATDAAGNEGTASRDITLDTVVSITIDEDIAGDDIIDSSEVPTSITGTVEAGSSVRLDIAGTVRTATVSGSSWSYTLTSTDIDNIGQGVKTITATATDALGNEGTASRDITVDTVVSMLTIDDITADNIINANEVSTSITGSVEAGSGVKLSLGGNVRTATVATDGTWSYILTSADIAAMEQGAETITVTATDAVDNVRTITQDLTVDTIAPAISIDEDIAGDDIIDSSEVPTSITGTVDAGSTVELSLDGNTRTITVEADGTWSYTLTLIDIDNIGQGVKTITATATDAAGNEGTASRDITLDTVVSITIDEDIAGDDIIDSSEVPTSITGTVEAGSSVRLDIAGTVRTATVSGSSWSYTLTSTDIDNIGQGVKTITATATDALGNEGTASRDITVDTVVSMLTIDDITADNIINANEVSTSITGSVEAGSGVKLTIGGNVRTATVTGTTWSYILTSAEITVIDQGAETITVTATDAAGNEGTASRDITVDTIAPAISIDEDIAGDDIIDSSEVPTSITGTVDAGSTVELSLDGNTRTITVEADGTWSYTLTLIDIDNIGQGVKTITATATDAAGNEGTASRDITLDTVVSITIDEDIAGDDIIDSSEVPTSITGTVDAGSTVDLSLDGMDRPATVIGTAWSYTLTSTDINNIGQGVKTITATATDALGNEGAQLAEILLWIRSCQC